MTDAVTPLPPWAGVPEGELEALLAKGKAKGELTLDEVLQVMKDVEVTTDVILGVRAMLHREGIALDETLDAAALPSGGPKARTTKAAEAGGADEDRQQAAAHRGQQDRHPQR